jgi:hypothetical protein
MHVPNENMWNKIMTWSYHQGVVVIAVKVKKVEATKKG